MSDDLQGCPFCGNLLAWADALIFGCAECGGEFWEEDETEITFEGVDKDVIFEVEKGW